MPITFGKENNDNWKCVKWETELTNSVDQPPAPKNEKFQLIRSLSSVFHFNLLCRYEQIINANEAQTVAQTVFRKGYFVQRKYEIELCLLQVDNSNNSDPTRSDAQTIPDYYRQPCAVYVTTSENGKYDLKKLTDSSNVWKSAKFTINLRTDQSNPMFTFELCITFNTLGFNEIKALKVLTDYFFFQQANCDVQFCFQDGKHIAGHMNILSARSPVFAAMFSHEMKEARTGQVAIQDIRPEIFKELLHFIYLGRTCEPLNNDTARPLFVAADKYDIVDLKHECVRFLLTQIQINNAIDHMVWADHHSVKDIKETALELVVANGKAICQTVEWEQLTKNYPELCLLAVRRMML